MTSECQIWDDGTYCAEGEENIKHTNKSCYCAMISQLNKISGECNGRFNSFLPTPLHLVKVSKKEKNGFTAEFI